MAQEAQYWLYMFYNLMHVLVGWDCAGAKRFQYDMHALGAKRTRLRLPGVCLPVRLRRLAHSYLS